MMKKYHLPVYEVNFSICGTIYLFRTGLRNSVQPCLKLVLFVYLFLILMNDCMLILIDEENFQMLLLSRSTYLASLKGVLDKYACIILTMRKPIIKKTTKHICLACNVWPHEQTLGRCSKVFVQYHFLRNFCIILI